MIKNLMILIVLLAAYCQAKVAEKVSEDENFVVYRIPVSAFDLQPEATGFDFDEPSYGRSNSKTVSHSKSHSQSSGSGKGRGFGGGSSGHGYGTGGGGSGSGSGGGGSHYQHQPSYGSGPSYGGQQDSHGQHYSSGPSYFRGGFSGHDYMNGVHGQKDGGIVGPAEIGGSYRSEGPAFSVNDFTRSLNQGTGGFGGQSLFAPPGRHGLSHHNFGNRGSPSQIFPQAYVIRHSGFGLNA